MNKEDFEFPERVPAPPEAIARAEETVKEFFLDCFWFRHPNARVRFLDDIELIIRHLREYGGWRAWWVAQDLRKCL